MIPRPSSVIREASKESQVSPPDDIHFFCNRTGMNTVAISVALYGIHLHHNLTIVFQRSKNIT
jgi:hypothetical protein